VSQAEIGLNLVGCKSGKATAVRLYILCISACLYKIEDDRKKARPPVGFPVYYVASSRNVCKRTPLEGFVPGSSRGVLLHTVQGT